MRWRKRKYYDEPSWLGVLCFIVYVAFFMGFGYLMAINP